MNRGFLEETKVLKFVYTEEADTTGIGRTLA